jgi:hypothetical protein
VDFWSLLKELREGWPELKAAKWAVCVGTVFGAVGGLAVSTLWWSGTVATLRERVVYWQDRAQGTSNRPDRHFLPEQREKLKSALQPLAPALKGLVVSAEPVPEAVRYSLEFMTVLMEAGITPQGPMFGFSENKDDKGVMVGLTDPTRPSDLAIRFIYALRSTGFDAKPVRWAGPSGGDVDFDLFIGTQ